MKLLTHSIAFLAFASTAPLATANILGLDSKKNKPKPTPQEIFKSLDKDKSGALSLEEYKAHHKDKNPAQLASSFKSKDTDSDGKLSLKEFTATHKVDKTHVENKPKADPKAAPKKAAAK